MDDQKTTFLAGLRHFIRTCRFKAFGLAFEVINALRNHACDWRFHADTHGIIYKLSTVGFDNPDFHACMPVSYRAIFRSLSNLPFSPAEISFLDIGCGKGRPLVVARALGFRRIRGVELIPAIAEVARTNLRGDADVAIGDATAFDIPLDTNVIYMANAFSGETLRKVMKNIERSCRSAPRPVVIVYFNPSFFDAMRAEFDWIHKTGSGHGGRWVYNLYEVHFNSPGT